MDAQHHQQGGGGNNEGGSKNDDNGSYLCRQISTRWMPTPDQLRILKDLYYNQGMRNPSAEEIKRISSRLSQFGKIEEKNVFYWFQNQKSREKQQTKRLATAAAIAAAPRDLQGHAAMRSKPETLPLFPMHGDNSISRTKQDEDSSQFSLELSLRPYSPTP